MSDELRVGELVQYYATKYDATVVGEVIELPDGHKGVKIRILRSPSPYEHLQGQEWFVSPNRLLKAGGRPRAFAGGDRSWQESLEETRDRVLRNLGPQLKPLGWTKAPRKELFFTYNPEWVSYHIWMHPRSVELKLTLGIKDTVKRDVAYDLLRKRQAQIEAALGNVQFNWKGYPPRTISQEVTWPGEEGPRPVDLDHIVERLTLYIRTIQPILKNL